MHIIFSFSVPPMFREPVNQHSNIQTSQDDVCWAGWATNTAKIADFHLKYSIEGQNLENKSSGSNIAHGLPKNPKTGGRPKHEVIKTSHENWRLRISVILLRSCRMTLEERSRCARLWGFNHVFSVFSYRKAYELGVFLSLMDWNWSVMSASEGINWPIDPRDAWEYMILGNKRPWRNRVSFSQEGG